MSLSSLSSSRESKQMNEWKKKKRRWRIFPLFLNTVHYSMFAIVAFLVRVESIHKVSFRLVSLASISSFPSIFFFHFPIQSAIHSISPFIGISGRGCYVSVKFERNKIVQIETWESRKRLNWVGVCVCSRLLWRIRKYRNESNARKNDQQIGKLTTEMKIKFRPKANRQSAMNERNT